MAEMDRGWERVGNTISQTFTKVMEKCVRRRSW